MIYGCTITCYSFKQGLKLKLLRGPNAAYEVTQGLHYDYLRVNL